MSDQPSSVSANDGDIIKIMIATDCHLGYQESDPNIGLDSFVTFEEILIMAVEENVDMILLGGDLFHDTNPSQQTLNRCMALLRRYTLGDKPVYLQMLSRDSPIERPEDSAPVNYMDPNMNVSIPVFSIHGNHDDPSGIGFFSAMDTLATAGLINYFGKWTDLSRIEVKPILLQKGETFLALYGLSHIKDERLSRLFLEEKVVMARPNEDPDKWFNIFVLHQNRVDRGPKRFISDSYLPAFLDLVMWGHEHDCDIVPEKNLDKGFYVTQPGSSVPTSLIEGETKTKHVGILVIEKRRFKLKPLKLQTTRPFLWECFRLMDVPVTTSLRERKSEEIRAACEAKVEEMIARSRDLLTGHPKQPTLPLIRLRCDYTDDSQLFNFVKFGQQFYQRVANPDTEVIKVKKIATHRDRSDLNDAKADLERLREITEEAPETFSSCVEAFVEKFFEKSDNKLTILSLKGMAEGVHRVIEKGETNAIDLVCQHQSDLTLKKLMDMDFNEDNVDQILAQIRDERCGKKEGTNQEMRNSGASSPELDRPADMLVLGDSDDDDPIEYPAPASSSRRGKTSRASSSRNGASHDSDIDMEDVPAPSRGRGRGRGGRGSRGGATTRARGTRAPRGAGKATAKTTLFPPAPVRNTPVRQAALHSQSLASYIEFEDSDD